MKYYIANKSFDSDKVVLPVTNIDACFGSGSFSRKWLPNELNSIIIRDPQSNGVSRYTLNENLIKMIKTKVQPALSSSRNHLPTRREESPVWALFCFIGYETASILFARHRAKHDGISDSFIIPAIKQYYLFNAKYNLLTIAEI